LSWHFVRFYAFLCTSLPCRVFSSVCEKNGATPRDLATEGTCRGLLEHHAAVLTTLNADSSALVSAAAARCTTLSAPEEVVLATSLSLRPFQLDPSFLWAPPHARNALFTWARDVYIAQLAFITDPFEAIPDDCAGDVLEFFGMTMHRVEALHVGAHWTSPEVRAWMRAAIAAAVAVKLLYITKSITQKCNTLYILLFM